MLSKNSTFEEQADKTASFQHRKDNKP